MKQNSTAMSTTAPFILNVRSRLETTTLIIRSVPHDRKMPIAQPSMHSTTLSSRNCWSITPRLAPMALRMPISRVRSVTVTSIIFMMPIPPTMRDIPAMPPRRIARMEVTLLIVSSRASCVSISKASSSCAKRS